MVGKRFRSGLYLLAGVSAVSLGTLAARVVVAADSAQGQGSRVAIDRTVQFGAQNGLQTDQTSTINVNRTVQAGACSDNTTYQTGKININRTLQFGSCNNNATHQSGEININRTIQVGADNGNRTAQSGGTNRNKTSQGSRLSGTGFKAGARNLRSGFSGSGAHER